MTITETTATRLLADLVRVESVTPWLIPTGSGERAVAELMAAWLADLPVDVAFDEIEPGRVNLIATLRGTGGGPTLGIDAHADTVGYANWAERALEPSVSGDRMVGLGVADDKSGCAAALLALRSLVESGVRLRGDLLVACVADEEGVSIGTEHLVAHHAMDAAIVIEPDGLPRAVVEHQGFGWIDLVVHGKAAHGSAPNDGVDAIVHMGEVIRGLDELDRKTFAATADSRNGKTVFHTGTIEGGTDYATYPSRAVLGCEIGTQPGEQLRDRLSEIDAIYTDLAGRLRSFHAETIVRLEREPFRAEGHAALMAALDASAQDVIGRPFDQVGLNAWTDAALVQAAGIPTVLIGSAGGNFHAPDEWASVSEVAQLARIVEGAARRFCGVEGGAT
jgi:acetylornithine deacetylase/succinyl-diaminopimelate desuccinylase-like protein